MMSLRLGEVKNWKTASFHLAEILRLHSEGTTLSDERKLWSMILVPENGSITDMSTKKSQTTGVFSQGWSLQLLVPLVRVRHGVGMKP